MKKILDIFKNIDKKVLTIMKYGLVFCFSICIWKVYFYLIKGVFLYKNTRNKFPCKKNIIKDVLVPN